MQKYFIDKKQDQWILTKEQEHQILHVMRAAKKDQFLFIYDGAFYQVEIDCLSPLHFKTIEKKEAKTELPVDITLLYCLPKGNKLDFVLQKATELGVKNIVLVESSRVITKIKKEDLPHKLERYRKIIMEAAEQCGRAYLPKIDALISFEKIDHYLSDLNFIAYEQETENFLSKKLLKNALSYSILIGPEGGFSSEEVLLAKQKGFQSVSLGKRILRSETAVLYSLSLLSNFAEEKEYEHL